MTSDACFDLRDRTIVVTGGLGQLGRAYTDALLARGARVAVVDVVGGDAVRVARFPDAPPDRLLLLAADITDRAQLEAALAEIEQCWGPPHGLVNNAAIDAPPDAPADENGPFESYPLASWERVLDVNVTGTFLCCQVFGGAMARAGRGAIVNIGSIYGVVSPNQRLYEYRRADGAAFFKPAAYATSKSAVMNLTRYLATYWAGQGVRVNTLTLAGVFNDQDERFLAAYTELMPSGRMARPDDYVGPLVFLLSDGARYMTGANLVVDGGWTAW